MARFKRADVLVCIGNLNGMLSSELTIGKEYVCLNMANCTQTVLVRNDLGRKCNYAITNFRKKI